MSDFALLHSRILDSSIWQLSKEARILWITMLAMKNRDGIVSAAEIGLADRAKLTLEECREALRIFHEPDPQSSNPAEQGRRIRDVQGGWQIINHEFYRFGTEAKREFWREQKAEQRAKDAERREKKKRGKKGIPLPQPAENAVNIAVAKLEAAGDHEGAVRAEEIDRERVELETKQRDEAVANALDNT